MAPLRNIQNSAPDAPVRRTTRGGAARRVVADGGMAAAPDEMFEPSPEEVFEPAPEEIGARIDAERRRNALLRQALSDADRTAAADQARYKSGLVAQDTVLSTQVDVLRARENLTASDAQLRQLSVALFKAIGGGWSETAAE